MSRINDFVVEVWPSWWMAQCGDKDLKGSGMTYIFVVEACPSRYSVTSIIRVTSVRFSVWQNCFGWAFLLKTHLLTIRNLKLKISQEKRLSDWYPLLWDFCFLVTKSLILHTFHKFTWKRRGRPHPFSKREKKHRFEFLDSFPASMPNFVKFGNIRPNPY